MAVDVLVVGPASGTTGGVARYVEQQTDHLPADVHTRVHDNRLPSGSGPAWALRAVLVTAWSLLRFPFRSEPDVLHVHSSHGFAFYRASVFVLLGRVRWRSSIVLHVHGSSFDEFVRTDSLVASEYQSFVFGAVDAVVVLSEYWKRTLSTRVAPGKLVVCPNAIDADGYDPTFGPTPPRVTFVSNHIARKGVEEFARAVERLLAAGHELEVTIAGSGPLADRSERLAERHESVTYLGYVSERRKRSLLDESSVYVLPTYAEGLPIALLEGMAGGNAVVTTAVASIPDVVGAENGELVSPGDVDELAAAIERLVTDPETTAEMGETNHELVASTYDWDAVSGELAALYRTLDGNRETRRRRRGSNTPVDVETRE